MCIFECVIINEQLRKAIRDAKSIADIGNECRRAKMLYLQEQALIKVMAGTTSIMKWSGSFPSRKNRFGQAKIRLSVNNQLKIE